MDLTEQNTVADKLSLKDLREMGRDEIAELVAAGLLAADFAAEIESEDHEKKEGLQQTDNRQRLQAQNQQDEQKKDDDWLQKMSQSYQQAYHQLMDTYDDAESEYGTIKTRAEELKDRLRQKVETARQYGISLPDGEQAFLDKKNNTFINAELQPLKENDAKEAAAEFKLLSPQQQKVNACYVGACNAYGEVADISQSADAGSENVQAARQNLENSRGTIAETELNRMRTDAKAQADGLSSRLNKAETADVSLDEALSADADAPATATENPQANSISFASLVAPNGNVIGNGNGKTATSFNAAANSAPPADLAGVNNVPAPTNRLSPTPTAP